MKDTLEVSKQEFKSRNSFVSYGLGIVLISIYSVLIYFQAVTASMEDSYQPGIGKVKAVLSPSLFLLIIVVLGMAAKKPMWRAVSNFVSGWAIVICVLIFSMAGWNYETSGYVPTEERYLFGTIYHSLTHPQFSNRSYFVAIYGAIIAAVLFAWSFLNSKTE